MEKRTKNFDIKEAAIDVMVDIVAGVLLAVSIQVFAVPAEFATAGANGIALILQAVEVQLVRTTAQGQASGLMVGRDDDERLLGMLLIEVNQVTSYLVVM